MTEVFRKLNFKGQDPILVAGAPDSFREELAAMETETSVHRGPKAGARYAFALAFAIMKADLLASAKSILDSAAADAVLWFAYPKKTSRKYTSDLNRDLCAAALKALKLQPVRQIAVDDDWSALRFKVTG